MAVNEEIVTGRKFRKLIDEATKLWQRISFWTKASDVEFDDGQTAETKVGAINGITDSLVSTSSNIAASAKALSTVNNNLTTQLPNDVRLITEGSGAGATYYVQLGADAASKKQLGRRARLIGTITGNGSVSCAGISGYNKLNSNDFIVEITSIHVTASYHRVGTGEGASTAGTCNISKSYNSSTGLLSVSGLNYSLMAGNAANYGKAVLVCTAKVYLV